MAAFFEYVLLVIQDIVLLLLIFHYLGTLNVLKVGLLGGFVALFYGFTVGIPHPGVLPAMIVSESHSLAVSILSFRMGQINFSCCYDCLELCNSDLGFQQDHPVKGNLGFEEF